MTPFAQLGTFEKSAYQGYDPTPQWGQPGSSVYNRPVRQAPVMQAGANTNAAPEKLWGVAENPWADAAISAIPLVGSAYMANSGVQNLRQGNVWRGVGDLGWAGLSLIPGVGLAKGGLKGLSAGAKAIAKPSMAGAGAEVIGGVAGGAGGTPAPANNEAGGVNWWNALTTPKGAIEESWKAWNRPDQPSAPTPSVPQPPQPQVTNPQPRGRLGFIDGAINSLS